MRQWTTRNDSFVPSLAQFATFRSVYPTTGYCAHESNDITSSITPTNCHDIALIKD